MNRSTINVVSGYLFFASTRVSDVQSRLQKANDGFGHFLWFYSDDYFDRVVVLFNSRICICETNNLKLNSLADQFILNINFFFQ